MENIEQHIQKDKEILQDPTTNPQMRRHIEDDCLLYTSPSPRD